MASSEPVCFTCGHPVAPQPFENRLADGRACPTCRDRILDEAPSLLPREAPYEEEEAWAEDYASPHRDDDDPIGA